MKIIEAEDYEDMSRKAAAILAAQVVEKPDSVLGLATGSTPIGIYKYLVQWYQAGLVDFSNVSTVNLDEYRGLKHSDPQSFYYFMNEHLFSQININPANVNIPDGTEPDPVKEAVRYEEIIRNLGGIDIQLIGIGHDGHIGFNEPGTAFDSITHCVNLTKMTIEANKRFFNSPDEVPRQAYTMGCGTIMHARKLLMVVSGADKANVLAAALQGKVTPTIPASIIQFHNDVTVIADKAAFTKVAV